MTPAHLDSLTTDVESLRQSIDHARHTTSRSRTYCGDYFLDKWQRVQEQAERERSSMRRRFWSTVCVVGVVAGSLILSAQFEEWWIP